MNTIAFTSRPEEPIRAEIFGLARFEQHAESLAAAQIASDRPEKGKNLLRRVRDNGRVLLAAYRNIVQAVRDKSEITPAEEWLLDNFHIVDEQIREVRDHLPARYYRLLPKIAEGHLAGYPRVYGVAWAYVAHTDSRFELPTLERFVQAYQRVQPLTIGEVWAVAIHLRVALIENLRRLAEQIIRAREARSSADRLADRLLGLGDKPPEDVDAVLNRLGEAPLSEAFAVELVQRLRDQDSSMMPVLHWLNSKLSAQGTTTTEIVANEHQAQAAANVTVRHIITSMRWMSSVDWQEYFEDVSLVDTILRTAPGFAAMDFATRNEYRTQIELLARGSVYSESDVAREAVLLARKAAGERKRAGDIQARDGEESSNIHERRAGDPGYYLLSRGRVQFEQRIGFRVPVRLRLRRAVRSVATGAYLWAITVVTLLVLAAPLYFAWAGGLDPLLIVVLGSLGIFPACDVAVAVVNRMVPVVVPPESLPKLELAGGVPPELKTMVVVPTLLTSHTDIEEQLERLEVHYLANPEGHLHFALLSDWKDASSETIEGDEKLLSALTDGIGRLNQRYGRAPDDEPRFFVLHRRRLWNEKEGEQGKWMGWERKRGKLHELNRLLRGATDTSFMSDGGRAPAVPSGVRFVITLDADTRLPKGTAYRLVGAMAHPLNRPRFDEEKRRVVAGYAILQPRITPSLPTGPESTPYQKIISGPGGVDPYAAAVSDVYQDLFGEGSYTGKGIYDIDSFERALAGKVPENALLSHDLFEGLFARAGLATDVDLFEEFPSNYEIAARRHHRWVRGDWQLLPWIIGRARDESRRRLKVQIPASGRWKMLDNLRRSMSAPATYLLAVTSWVLPGVNVALWTGLAIGSIVVPNLIPVVDGLTPQRLGISKRSHMRAVRNDAVVAATQSLLAVTVLAHQAWLMTDALIRTLWRLFVSKRNLLEWVAAAQAGYGIDLRLRSFIGHLRWGVALGALAATLVLLLKPTAWPVAAPLALLWVLSPVLAWRVSLPAHVPKRKILSAQQIDAARRVARRTWRFFETFVTEQGHYLPPDNFQEDPEPVKAHRTSPTNIGLYLLSTMTAYDFGWIGIQDTIDRLEKTLGTMNSMRRVRGHFLNWYDTRDLRPLEPMYVSTVDSGNLAGHLMALIQGLNQLKYRQPLNLLIPTGIRDALDLFIVSLEEIEQPHRAHVVTPHQLREAADTLYRMLDEPPGRPSGWHDRLRELDVQAATLWDMARALSAEAVSPTRGSEISAWAKAVLDSVRSHLRDLATESSASDAEVLEHRISALALLAERMVLTMDFQFLFDRSRRLFSIGYRVTDGTMDPSSYDLLASEARLASFVAIAKGDVPPRHWFLLGRSLTPVGGGAALLSWSGSMFEYLMPLLVMREPAHSLLDLTSRLVVARQIRYGLERGVPWGVSESAYNVRDVELTYQYSDFGVPGLGLKRGLFEDVVVAPYATALAAMVDPNAALDNLNRLETAGGLGVYGFYEALDYTPSRLPDGTDVAVVLAYMAHHQGMTIVALGNLVHGGIMQHRFHSNPMVVATELLLQERTPRAVSVARPRGEEVEVAVHVRDVVAPTLRRFESPHDLTPRTHLLSNGRFTSMVTAAGGGFIRRGDIAITRWREDSTRDCWGNFIFLRDVETNEVWSAGFQPAGTEAEHYEVVYSEDRAKIIQRHGSLAITLEIVVSPEDDAELRRLTVTNLENRDREIDFTSYAEVVLASQGADLAHPTFSNLFVQTEFVAALDTLLATRRPRTADEPQTWLAHVVAVEGETQGEVQYETDRARFLGRGRGIRTPLSVIDGGPLSNTVGAVLDPIVSLRQRVVIPQGETVNLLFTTLVAPSRREALEVAEKYGQPATFDRESSLAWTQAQVQLHHLRMSQDEAHLFQRLANRLIYADPTLRATPEDVARNEAGQSDLWRYGISGDLPICMVQIEVDEQREVVRQLLRAHEYWNLKGVFADLVILNAKETSYVQDLQQSLEAMVEAIQSAVGNEESVGRGEVFVLRADLVPPRDQLLLRSAARIVINAAQGTLAEQVVRLLRTRPGPVPPSLRVPREEMETIASPVLDLQSYNGLGGFTTDGREYVTVLGKGQWTPAPWINVVSNQSFGFQVSESGAGYTWSENSRENKLTPWSNDPVSDTPGEIFYVRDEDSGVLWGPTALPIREESWPYVVRHGQGYSRFQHTAHGIALELTQFVAVQDPVKVCRLILENESKVKRRLLVTSYVEWVLGVERSESATAVVTELDPDTGAMLARNSLNREFAGRVAFADMLGAQTSCTGDRLEFLGRNASLDHPASLERGGELSGRTGACLDPCAVLQTKLELEPGESTEVVVLLGEGRDRAEARLLIERYRAVDCDALLQHCRNQWDRFLDVIQVETPDPALDILLNRWLPYQVRSCRLQARSAFYQSGGAFGFRDQLQDVLALAATEPGVVRDQLLRAAARQFRAGDVQHWWHPPSGRGVRTRISDDRLWLPYAVTHYLTTTGDWAVLDEPVSWLDGRELDEAEQEAYFEPTQTDDAAPLYEHCARALDCSLELGEHGLPLMGAGDWNDGMNRVGWEGRGESVWLGWFLVANLREFAPIAERRGEKDRAVRWRDVAHYLEESLEREAWDGDWYRRAFFDDGTPLGSAQNDECQIDSIAQSWAVLSGAANKERATRAMAAVEQRLVDRERGLIRLFTPPFNRTEHDPGYIKGYVPGIRENGGQYTHAAIWVVAAFAQLGEGNTAVELFDLLNPVNHASSRTAVHRYKVEPYAVAADVYSQPPHVGRGGWTWYTGSAGWLYRVALEWILGFHKQGEELRIDPCISREWDGFQITYRYRTAVYHITVENPNHVSSGVVAITLDDAEVESGSGDILIPLSDDDREHHVRVTMG
ncbi:MAG: glycosyl transferase [Gemmatimonadota bacterium]|nr:MAG: glycosyl transferase [Gemmatimonadota bacterium]